MSKETLTAANYHNPPFSDKGPRCRDCQEQRRAPGYGSRITCGRHEIEVRHSYRCADFHDRGTLI